MPNSEDNTKVLCPYDPSHVILKSRFQVHLDKCRKQHKNIPKEICPFNVTHVLNRKDLDSHVVNCPNRGPYENFKNRDEAPTSSNPPMRPSAAFGPSCDKHYIESTENWDDEPDAESYNPEEYASNAQVLRTMKGQSKSAKKRFRAQERLRLMGIDNN